MDMFRVFTQGMLVISLYHSIHQKTLPLEKEAITLGYKSFIILNNYKFSYILRLIMSTRHYLMLTFGKFRTNL